VHREFRIALLNGFRRLTPNSGFGGSAAGQEQKLVADTTRTRTAG
jgi:hypothetical protein